MNNMNSVNHDSVEALEALMTIGSASTTTTSRPGGNAHKPPAKRSGTLASAQSTNVRQLVPIAPHGETAMNNHNQYGTDAQHQHTNASVNQSAVKNVTYTFALPPVLDQSSLSQIGQFLNPPLAANSNVGKAPYSRSSLSAPFSAAPSVLPAAQDTLDRGKPRAEPIRVDEIERALKSKPQRGKKRNNLNCNERKELTRSRNRMHAKTTRTRKKARHDELVEREQKYLQMMEERNRHDAQRKSVLKFISLRSELLNSSSGSNENAINSSWEIAVRQAPLNEEEESTFVHQDIFAPHPTFSIVSNGITHMDMNFQGLQDYEHSFADELREMVSDTKSVEFEYFIPQAVNGVALSKANDAFAAYEMTASTGGSQKDTLSSGFVQVFFVEQSHRIAHVKIHVASVQNAITHSDNTASPLGDSEAFPSVVSLERHLADTKQESS